MEAPELQRVPIVPYHACSARDRAGSRAKKNEASIGLANIVFCSNPTSEGRLLSVAHLLREIVCKSHLADGVQLCLQPINVMLFVVEDALGQRLGCVIPLSDA